MSFVRSLRRLAAAALVAWLAFGLQPAAAGTTGEPGYASWFRTSDEVLANWTVTPVEGDPLQAVIRHRSPFQSVNTQHVLVLYPRPSSP